MFGRSAPVESPAIVLRTIWKVSSTKVLAAAPASAFLNCGIVSCNWDTSTFLTTFPRVVFKNSYAAIVSVTVDAERALTELFPSQYAFAALRVWKCPPYVKS